MSRAFLTYAVRKIADLVEEDGWAAEYPRDVWQLRRLGFPGGRTVRFTGIAQPWLRELAKRWVRWRLSSGLGPEAAAARPALAITRFSAFLTTNQVTDAAGVNRLLLERYLADLHTEFAGRNQHTVHIGQLSLFLAAVRRHRWEQLPADAMFYSVDIPKRPERPPRALADQVMSQVEQPANLDRWNNRAYRLVTLVLIRCGLRVTDALRLPIDCVVTDGDGAAYLRYHNHKMKREALVPIDEELRILVDEQRRDVAGRWPETVRLLFPRPTKNIDGAQPLSSSTYRLALYRWLRRCDIRDEHGKPIHLTPHQWRHTLGTTLINRDVPQEVVRRILDHDSPQMTAHYARMHDNTVRRHWEQARKVNIQGAEGQRPDWAPDESTRRRRPGRGRHGNGQHSVRNHTGCASGNRGHGPDPHTRPGDATTTEVIPRPATTTPKASDPAASVGTRTTPPAGRGSGPTTLKWPPAAKAPPWTRHSGMPTDRADSPPRTTDRQTAPPAGQEAELPTAVERVFNVRTPDDESCSVEHSRHWPDVRVMSQAAGEHSG